MKYFVPLGPLGAVKGFSHRLEGLKRIITSADRRTFADELLKRGFAIELMDENGKLRTCTVCGYAVVKTKPQPGWTAFGCSARGMTRLLTAPGASAWSQQLAPAVIQPQSAETAERSESGMQMAPH